MKRRVLHRSSVAGSLRSILLISAILLSGWPIPLHTGVFQPATSPASSMVQDGGTETGGREGDDEPADDEVELVEPEEAADHGTEVPSPLLLPSEYTFAGGPRYTVLGTMPNRETDLRPIPALITGSTVAAMALTIHFFQQNAWWSDRRTDFHFTTDWGYAAQADKFGHLYAGYMASYVGYEMLIASGVSPDAAGWIGPLLAIGFQTYVEIEDGFSPFGFDPTDQYANMIGPLFFGLRHYIEPLQNFAIKWSYFPNTEYDEGVRDGHGTIVVDDYNGQTIWFSAKVGNLLPDAIPWPDWLRIAVGYGATNVDRWDPGDVLLQPGRRGFIALDYDLVEMIPDIGWFGNWLVQSFDNFRWPAPAFQFAPEPKFYIAWPFTI